MTCLPNTAALHSLSGVVLAMVLLSTPALAAEKAQATAPALKKGAVVVQKARPGTTTTGSVVTGGTGQAPSPRGCTTLGGKGIVVADDRCGSTQRYCKMPSGLAACIDKMQ